MSLTRQLTLILVCILGALWAAVIWDYTNSESRECQRLQNQTAALSLAFAEHTELTLSRGDFVLLQLREAWISHKEAFTDVIDRYQQLLDNSVVQIGVVDTEGILVFSTAGGTGIDLSDREHIKVHKDGNHEDFLFVSRPLKGRASGKWSIQLTRPILDKNKFAGIIVLSIDPNYFVRFYQKISLGKQGIVVILRDTGEIMARSPAMDEYIGKELKFSPVALPGAPQQGNFRGSLTDDDVERIKGYVMMSHYGLTVIVGAGVEEQLQPVRIHQHTLILLSIAITILLILLFWYMLRGIVKREEAERKVSEFNRDFEAFLNQTTDHIYFKDIQGRFRFCSQAFAIITGNPHWRNMIGKTAHDIYPPKIASQIELDDQTIITKGEPILNRDDSYYDNDANQRFLSTRKWPLTDDSGVIVGTFGISRDITEQRKAEKILEEALSVAEAANRSKSAFLANMSHEIRTPINAILGMANILRREGVNPTQSERLSKIESATSHLLSTLNDILDLSKIEAGKFALDETEVSIPGILANVQSILLERSLAKDLYLKVDCAPFFPILYGDPIRIQQSLLNYASNAIKFTERGSVTLKAFLKEDNDNTSLIRFEVHDTGIGISPQTIPKLFSAFEQADSSTTRKYGGTGLGLAITRHLVELMDGQVGVESIPNIGSIFWFTARLNKHRESNHAQQEETTDAELIIKEKHQGRLILLVDDEPINLEIARFLLDEAGLAVDVATDGLEAVAQAREKSYELILMDMQMPHMNGIDATKQIRKLPSYQDTPILALTANAFAEDKTRCLNAGMNDFIIKPLEPNVLFSSLVKWLQKRIPR